MKKHLKGALVFLIALSCIVSVMIIIGAIMIHDYSKDRIDDEVLETIRSDGKTHFYHYDRNGQGELIFPPTEIVTSSQENCTDCGYVTFDRIPKNLINAFIAIEDKRFYSHHGIDYSRSAFAVFNYLFKGKKSFGGSTVTQQLVKNITGDDSVTVKRKISEAFAAMDLERRCDKSEILELYLNIINLSHGCYGISDAAEYYFSKSVEALTLSESASVAAITNNPSKYDPISHPNENIKRRDLILRNMYDLGFITIEEYNDAINEKLTLKITDKKSSVINSWYIDTVVEDVINDLAAKYGISSKKASLIFYKGGFRIYTAMDIDVQSAMENFYNDINNFPSNADGRTPQSSMIAIDPLSGDVLGVIGAIGQKSGVRLLNYATASKRPSGSAIKPLSVYAPALESGLISWSTVIEDSPIRQGNNTSSPWPSNANNEYVGMVNIEYAVKHSLNTVAVKILRQLGNERSYDFLKNGLMINSLDKANDTGDASLALGQHSRGITLRELVAAYSIFSDGIMKKSRTYYKVTDNRGMIILDNQPSEVRVISEENAAIMTKLLQEVINDGTASSLIDFEDLTEAAGKTGTTQHTYDKYFVGFTPTVLAGVWQGFEMPESLDFVGYNYSAVVWNEIIGNICRDHHRYTRQTKFRVPQCVKKLSYNKVTGGINGDIGMNESFDEGWFDIKSLNN